MILTLIRHSETLINPDIPITSWGLSENGAALANQLSNLPEIHSIDVIYSSLQTKALETAVLETKNLGIPIKTDNRLTEITSFTNKFERDLEIFSKNVKDFYTGKIEQVHGGETAQQGLERFNRAINNILETEKNKENIGIVSHGGILTYFCTQFIKRDRYELLESIKQPDIAILDWDSKKFTKFFGEIVLN